MRHMDILHKSQPMSDMDQYMKQRNARCGFPVIVHKVIHSFRAVVVSKHTFITFDCSIRFFVYQYIQLFIFCIVALEYISTECFI
jgi:hypothetical protein